MELEWLPAAMEDWPEDLPRLYPDLDDRSLCSFFNKEQCRQVRNVPKVVILPIASSKNTELDKAFGAATARLLMRDLMLVGDLSIASPEDTPWMFMEEAHQIYPYRDERAIWVSGSSRVRRDSFGAELRFHRPGMETCATVIKEPKFLDFLSQCAATIVSLAGGGTVPDSVQKMWTIGRPATVKNLVDFGQILTRDISEEEKSRLAVKLWFHDKNFALALQMAKAEYEPNLRSILLEAFDRDPYNAQLCYQLFHALWSGRGYEPYALQYLRRAIELSPGHGRAHLHASRALHPDANVLIHSHLGYRLLPGNTQAIDNYIHHLSGAGQSPTRLLKLAKKGLKADPYDPSSYYRLIDLYIEMEQYDEALQIAERLNGLLMPEIDERAWQCMEQNPHLRDKLLSGEYDPVQENLSLIRQLRDAVSAGSSSLSGSGWLGWG